MINVLDDKEFSILVQVENTLSYQCEKINFLPYYSQNDFTIYTMDMNHMNRWFKQDLRLYIYSNKVKIFKNVMKNVIGVVLIVFVVLSVLAVVGYCRSKKEIKMKQRNKAI